MKNTIDTTLQVSKEPRVVVEGFVGSNDQFINNLQPLAEKLAHVQEEGVEEEEDDDEDEEFKNEEENKDAFMA